MVFIIFVSIENVKNVLHHLDAVGNKELCV